MSTFCLLFNVNAPQATCPMLHVIIETFYQCSHWNMKRSHTWRCWHTFSCCMPMCTTKCKRLFPHTSWYLETKDVQWECAHLTLTSDKECTWISWESCGWNDDVDMKVRDILVDVFIVKHCLGCLQKNYTISGISSPHSILWNVTQRCTYSLNSITFYLHWSHYFHVNDLSSFDPEHFVKSVLIWAL